MSRNTLELLMGVLLLGLFGVVSPFASARLLVLSPETVISNSDAIVVGVITSKSENENSLSVIVQVEEILKGTVDSSTINLTVRPYLPNTSLTDAFPQEGTRVFMALNNTQNNEHEWILAGQLNAVAIVENGCVAAIHEGSTVTINDGKWTPSDYIEVYNRFYLTSTGHIPYTDMKDHWSLAAVQKGVAYNWVSGYPDGSFRPDDGVTRAEFIKLLVEAAKLPQIEPDSFLVFTDVYDHWVFEMGYLAAAGRYGFLEAVRYGTILEPDKRISRMDAAIMAMAMMGRQYQANSNYGEACQSLADSIHIPQWARGWIAEALKDGVVNGYTDHTFRPEQSLTRAEAVVLVQRAIESLRTGLEPTLKLIVDDELQVGITLARKGDIFYAPAGAVYGHLDDTQVIFQEDRLLIFPGNGIFRFEVAPIQMISGAQFAFISQKIPGIECEDLAQWGSGNSNEMKEYGMLAPTYMLNGNMMLPVAAIDK